MDNPVTLTGVRRTFGGTVALDDVSLTVHAGELEGLAVWLLEDAPADTDGRQPAWTEAFPIWLAAASGAVASCSSAMSSGSSRSQHCATIHGRSSPRTRTSRMAAWPRSWSSRR